MRCAVCNSLITSFKLLTSLNLKAAVESQGPKEKGGIELLPSIFDDMKINDTNNNFGIFDNMSELSSDAGTQAVSNTYHGNLAVLRIDNVPWVSGIASYTQSCLFTQTLLDCRI